MQIAIANHDRSFFVRASCVCCVLIEATSLPLVGISSHSIRRWWKKHRALRENCQTKSVCFLSYYRLYTRLSSVVVNPVLWNAHPVPSHTSSCCYTYDVRSMQQQHQLRMSLVGLCEKLEKYLTRDKKKKRNTQSRPCQPYPPKKTFFLIPF